MANSSDLLTISVLQPRLKLNDLDYNLKSYSSILTKFSTKLKKSQVICFPEYWNGIRKDKYSDNVHDLTLEFLKNTSFDYSAFIIGGSHLFKENKTFKNRSHVLSPEGKLIGFYDKRHPFGYEQHQGIMPGEKDFFFKIGKWKATIRICNDLWNTHDHSILIKEGIDIIFSPILTSLSEQSYTNYGRFLWHNLAVIRSKEAASAVVVSDSAIQVIKEPYWCAGASCIADPSSRFSNQEPFGTNLLVSIPDGKENILSVTLDLNKIQEQKQYRLKMGLMENE